MLTAKLLCCPTGNSACFVQPTSCSVNDTLGYCQNITQLEACSRATTEPAVQAVCQNKNSLFCLKSQTNYDEKNVSQSALIGWMLSRNIHGLGLSDSQAGVNKCCDSNWFCWDNPSVCGSTSWFATCDDLFSSGKCLAWQKGQAPSPFPYQVELCDTNFASIIGTIPSETGTVDSGTFISSSPTSITNNPITSGVQTNNSVIIVGATLGGAVAILIGVIIFGALYFKKQKTLPVSLPLQEERIRDLEMELEQLRGLEGKNERLRNIPHEQYQAQVESASPSRFW